MHVVYLIVHKENGKVYVGKTSKTLEERWKGHLKKRPAGRMTYFTRALAKYGPDVFDKCVIDCSATNDEASELEKAYIEAWRSREPDFGYNTAPGGNGIVPTEEWREKLRKAQTGKKLSEETKRKIGESGVGRRASLETRKKRSASLKGRIFSAEHRAKLSKAARINADKTRRRLTGMKRPQWILDKLREANVGRKATPEARQNMSKAQLGVKRSEQAKANMSRAQFKRWAARKAGPVETKPVSVDMLGQQPVPVVSSLSSPAYSSADGLSPTA